jgi:hypothetical protein
MKPLVCLAFLILQMMVASLPAQSLWQTVGGGMEEAVLDIYADTLTDKLYICGFFKYAGGQEVNQTVTWDGQNWGLLGVGAGGSDSCHYQNCTDLHWIAPHEGQVFVGGQVGFFDSTWHTSRITRFDGSDWLPCGYPNSASLPLTCNGELFVVGDELTQIGGVTINNVAIWNDSTWDAFGGPLDFEGGYLICAEHYQNRYHFAGNFRHFGPYQEIISWDGNQWQPLGPGIVGDSWVNRIKEYKGLLYVAGEFNRAVGNADDYLMAWDGSHWWPTFPDVQFISQVIELEVIDDMLYMVGEHFVMVNGQWRGPYNLAKWDGTDFCSFGGPAFRIEDIAGLDGRIYISTRPALSPDSLQFFAEYIGGSQDETCIPQAVPDGLSDCLARGAVSAYPNPATTSATLQWTAPSADTYRLSIYNGLGQRVQQSLHDATPGSNTLQLELSDLTAGTYLVSMLSSDRHLSTKLVVR